MLAVLAMTGALALAASMACGQAAPAPTRAGQDLVRGDVTTATLSIRMSALARSLEEVRGLADKPVGGERERQMMLAHRARFEEVAAAARALTPDRAEEVMRAEAEVLSKWEALRKVLEEGGDRALRPALREAVDAEARLKGVIRRALGEGALRRPESEEIPPAWAAPAERLRAYRLGLRDRSLRSLHGEVLAQARLLEGAATDPRDAREAAGRISEVAKEMASRAEALQSSSRAAGVHRALRVDVIADNVARLTREGSASHRRRQMRELREAIGELDALLVQNQL